MLNIELIDNLFATINKERQQQLLELLFKRSKQNINYFRWTKDISLSKLEILADFFCMPLDFFRKGRSQIANNVYGDNNLVGIICVNTNMVNEIKGLKDKIASQENELKSKISEIKTLKGTLQAKDDTLEAKDEALSAKDMLIETLQKQIDTISGLLTKV